jgi:hypothetical protein
MEVIIFLVIIVAILSVVLWNSTSKLDVNKDGKVDVQDAKVVAEKVATGVKKTATKTATKAKAAVKKATGKKPAVKAKTAGRGQSRKV